MKKYLLIILLFVLSFPVFSQQLSKVFILSEGGFSPGTSKLSMLDVINNNFSDNIFTPGNLGLYPDGIILYGDHLYMVEQGNFGGSGKIYKTDTTGFILNSAETGTNPYSLAVANNKIYITNGPASNVTVLKLDDLSFIKNITVGIYPQEILSDGNKVFVANNSVYGGTADSTVSVIDAVLDTAIATITVKKDPSALALSNDGHLFIGCPGDADNGKIFEVNTSTYQITETINLPTFGFGKEIVPDKNSNDIYFFGYTNDLVKYNTGDKSAAVIIASVFPNNYFYGYNYDYISKRHYILDAKDFSSAGALYVYDNTGGLINSYSTGTSPRRVVFKYNGIPVGTDDSPLAAGTFQLKQNYPNPFNPVTKIQYEISSRQFVSLKVYDVLGKVVNTLVNEEKSPGTYDVNFDAGMLSSGIYFYKLEAGSFIQVKKMTLVK